MLGRAALTTLMSRTTRTWATRARAMTAHDWFGWMSGCCSGRRCSRWKRPGACEGADACPGMAAADWAEWSGSIRLMTAPRACMRWGGARWGEGRRTDRSDDGGDGGDGLGYSLVEGCSEATKALHRPAGVGSSGTGVPS